MNKTEAARMLEGVRARMEQSPTFRALICAYMEQDAQRMDVLDAIILGLAKFWTRTADAGPDDPEK